MKKCPYCAEEIQDEAIKCRYCFSDLTVSREEALGQRPEPEAASEPAPEAASAPEAEAASEPATETTGAPETEAAEAEATPTPAEPTPSSEPGTADAAGAHVDASVRYSHSGYRYVLGYGDDYFGIWDRQSPTQPAERFPRTDEGWRSAWVRFVALEPKHVEVPQSGSASTEDHVPGGAASGTSTGSATSGTAAGGTAAGATYTHSGTRYLLGYGEDFFGIWDRQNPAEPVERFPRTDDGWAQAWRRYTAIESNFIDVPKG